MAYPDLEYRNGQAHCPVEGCGWRVPDGNEMRWPKHRDDYHNGNI